MPHARFYSSPRVALLAACLLLTLPACEFLYPGDDDPDPDASLNAFEYIASTPELDLLEGALRVAGLDEALAGEGPFTVFAPVNEAFLALATELSTDVDGLLALPELPEILTYHVVAGQTIRAEDIEDGATVHTLQGGALTFHVEGDRVTVNDSIHVIQANVEVTNGVIHLIDGVLLPPTDS